MKYCNRCDRLKGARLQLCEECSEQAIALGWFIWFFRLCCGMEKMWRGAL